MEKVIEFLTDFDGQRITIEELSSELNLDEEALATFLSDYDNYNSLHDKLYVKVNYYNKDGTKSEDSFAHLIGFGKDKREPLEKKASYVVNRQYLSEDRLIDIYLHKQLKNETVRFGYVQDDAGYRGDGHDAWLDGRGYEIPKYTHYANLAEDMLSFLNCQDTALKKEDNLWRCNISQGRKQSLGESPTLAKAICLSIKHFLETHGHKGAYQVVGRDEEGTIMEISKILRNEIEAQMEQKRLVEHYEQYLDELSFEIISY